MTRAVVVGGGTWGTSFSRLLVDRGFEVTLAVRDAEVARAIAETGVRGCVDHAQKLLNFTFDKSRRLAFGP